MEALRGCNRNATSRSGPRKTDPSTIKHAGSSKSPNTGTRQRMLRLVQQARFFDLFEKQSDLTVKGAAALHDLIYEFRDSPAKAAAIKAIEHEADLVTHEIFRNLNTTFVTPLDREDIHSLATRLDDVLDFMEAVAERL